VKDKTAEEDVNDDGYINAASPGAGEFLEPNAKKSEGKVDDENDERNT
jgi:hypothetical protein